MSKMFWIFFLIFSVWLLKTLHHFSSIFQRRKRHTVCLEKNSFQQIDIFSIIYCSNLIDGGWLAWRINKKIFLLCVSLSIININSPTVATSIAAFNRSRMVSGEGRSWNYKKIMKWLWIKYLWFWQYALIVT